MAEGMGPDVVAWTPLAGMVIRRPGLDLQQQVRSSEIVSGLSDADRFDYLLIRILPSSERGGPGVCALPFQTPIRFLCRDIGPETRKGQSEGLITAALCHPLEATSGLLAQTMIYVINQVAPMATLERTIPFDIVTPVNI